jgi:hypothetical protein
LGVARRDKLMGEKTWDLGGGGGVRGLGSVPGSEKRRGEEVDGWRMRMERLCYL